MEGLPNVLGVELEIKKICSTLVWGCLDCCGHVSHAPAGHSFVSGYG